MRPDAVPFLDQVISLSCAGVVVFVAVWDALWAHKYLKHFWGYKTHFFPLILTPALFSLANAMITVLPRSGRFFEDVMIVARCMWTLHFKYYLRRDGSME